MTQKIFEIRKCWCKVRSLRTMNGIIFGLEIHQDDEFLNFNNVFDFISCDYENEDVQGDSSLCVVYHYFETNSSNKRYLPTTKWIDINGFSNNIFELLHKVCKDLSEGITIFTRQNLCEIFHIVSPYIYRAQYEK